MKDILPVSLVTSRKRTELFRLLWLFRIAKPASVVSAASLTEDCLRVQFPPSTAYQLNSRLSDAQTDISRSSRHAVFEQTIVIATLWHNAQICMGVLCGLILSCLDD